MQANYVQRLRIQFSKIGQTRYIGHLDLARTLERAFNRAALPISYTQGFNKRPRMQLAAALPLGFTSECELVDIWLQEAVDPAAAQTQIAARMAPGIVIQSVVEIPLSEPPLQNRTVEAVYIVTLLDPIDEMELAQRVANLLATSEMTRARRDKTYDLRPLIHELTINKSSDGRLELHMRLALLPSQTGRPDEVALALGLDPLALWVHRKHIGLEPLK
ncbi:MAG: hypothetical protein Fur0021_19920 [Candidatus Promineifilaceae bacterium]